MGTVLITGITGQDGSYLAEQLICKNYKVIGTVRNKHQDRLSLPVSLIESVEFVEWDLNDSKKLSEILSFYRPEEFYNFAAYSSGSGMYSDAVKIGEVNGLAVARILESIRQANFTIRFCQASSREIFGEALETPQNELTPCNPRSPYGAAKLYADSMIKIYRKHYGLFVCSAILFNHESPRRKHEFVTRKITYTASKIKLGLEKVLFLGNLDSQRDWGFAGDYVHAMWLMLQQSNATDYVIASGNSYSVRQFCEYTFNYLGLDYRDYVIEDPTVFRPIEPYVLVGNPSKAKINLGWEPMVGLEELIRMMVDEDMRSLVNDH